MLKTRLLLPLLLCLSGALVGCASDTSDLPELPGFTGGKADVSDQINLRGAIAFGGSVEGVFEDDLQYDGYAFQAVAGAVISVETTQRGSARDLDDVILIYGPDDPVLGYEDATRIGGDDDSGWGRHARVEGLVLEEAGNYLVIVGTKNGQGRGQYRVELGCDSGACAPAAPTTDVCPGLIMGRIELCYESERFDDGESAAVAFESCTDEFRLIEDFEDDCSDASPPEFCALDAATFESEVVATCQAEAGLELGLAFGPVAADGSAFGAEYADLDTARARERLGGGFNGISGVRDLERGIFDVHGRRELEAALRTEATASDLMEFEPSWEQDLIIENDFDGFSEEVELEWELNNIVEFWVDGEVVGYGADNYATVSYWDDSDPDDPVSVSFETYVFVGVDGFVVGEYFGGPGI
ncbi:MAG: hypothetical protein AAF411_21895 [Myxococcota bacterium]